MNERLGWDYPPAEPYGNVKASDVAGGTDEQLRIFAAGVLVNRYGPPGRRTLWFNHLLGGLEGKSVCDYGCGFGWAGLACAHMGCSVALSDIELWNVFAAARLMMAHGFTPVGIAHQTLPDVQFDVLIMDGVLHHMHREDARQLFSLVHAHGCKEVRAMVYTDLTWAARTGTSPPTHVADDPQFDTYVKSMDGVGHFADWYNADKLFQCYGDFIHVTQFTYLPDDGDERHFGVARMQVCN